MSAKKIALAHPMTMKDMVVGGDGYLPIPNFGIVTHENVPPGTVIIWPQGGADPTVMDVDQLTGKLTTELAKVPTPLTPKGEEYWSLLTSVSPNPYMTTFEKAVEAELHKYVVLPPPPPTSPPKPTTELIDSSNPFAKALDAWQTGKAEWVKGSLYQPATQGEPA